jgi:hypothetical protein
MTAKEIMQALIDGKKVGTTRGYMYLNCMGNIGLNPEDTARKEAFQIGMWLLLGECTIQAEDGP